MPSSKRWTDESGSASLEFIGAGLMLLVPVVYLVLTLSALQCAALAVDGAARQATRVFVQGDSIADARSAASRAIEVTLADYGVGAPTAVQITCRPQPAACLTRRGFVTVSITVVVPLPMAPPVLDLGLPAGVPVSATATEQVSRFWGSR
jgi:hypothetical protein